MSATVSYAVEKNRLTVNRSDYNNYINGYVIINVLKSVDTIIIFNCDEYDLS